jgi:hypothetical protein
MPPGAQTEQYAFVSLCFSSNSRGIHVYHDEFCVEFLYNLCWYFSDISPDTPSHTTHGGGRNNRVFVIVVNRNFTSYAVCAPGPHEDLQHSALEVLLFLAFVSRDWTCGWRRCLSCTGFRHCRAQSFLNCPMQGCVIPGNKKLLKDGIL